jgi:hypothetical protein
MYISLGFSRSECITLFLLFSNLERIRPILLERIRPILLEHRLYIPNRTRPITVYVSCSTLTSSPYLVYVFPLGRHL